MTTQAFTQPIELEADGEYQQALQHLQEGRWDEAIRLLEALQSRYPRHPLLETMLQQARLKAQLGQEEARARRLRVPASFPKLLRLGGLLLMALLAAAVAFLLYTRVILPYQMAQARQAEQERLLREGQEALAVGAYQRAAEAFRQLLAEVPDSVPAREGLAIAEEKLRLAERYQQAVALQEAGRITEALAAFEELYQIDPDYADVAQRIKTLRRRLEVQRYYDEATAAYREGRWAEAIAAYEAVRNLDLDFRQEEVTQRLLEAYRRQAQMVIERPEDPLAAAREGIELLNQALSLRPRDAELRAKRARLYEYLRGEEALAAGRWDEAVSYLEPIYQEDPRLLGGAVARALYRAYLEQGKAYEARGEYVSALERYQRAASLEGVDTAEAQQRIQRIAPLTTPTPTPTPTAPPTPTPTPTPTPLPLSAYRGWIAFKTDRDGGVRIYVMRPDGSDPRPVSDPENYEKLEEREAYSPDGTRRVYNEGDNKSTPLYIWRYDVPPTWERRRQLLDNSAINYQPAWSPKGDLIAFVSQVTGNDEIWVISADEREKNPTPKQLTFNTWEWDKHPTWSPDGEYIAFWSNRITGRRQIWVMRKDGSDQVNISQNEYNDWDPVWIK